MTPTDCTAASAAAAAPFLATPHVEPAAANSRLALYASKRLLLLVWSTEAAPDRSAGEREEATSAGSAVATSAAGSGANGVGEQKHVGYFLVLVYKQPTFQQQQLQLQQPQEQQQAFCVPPMEVVGCEEMQRRWLRSAEKNCFLRCLAEFCTAAGDPLELLVSGAHGLLGLLPLVSGFFLCVATEAAEVASFLGVHKIYSVQETKLIPLFTTASISPSFRVYVHRVLRAAADAAAFRCASPHAAAAASAGTRRGEAFADREAAAAEEGRAAPEDNGRPVAPADGGTAVSAAHRNTAGAAAAAAREGAAAAQKSTGPTAAGRCGLAGERGVAAAAGSLTAAVAPILTSLRATIALAAAAASKDARSGKCYGAAGGASAAATAADARYEQLLKAFPLERGCYFCKSFFLCLPLQQLAARRAVQFLASAQPTARARGCSCDSCSEAGDAAGCNSSNSRRTPRPPEMNSRCCAAATAAAAATSTTLTDFLGCSELEEEEGPLRREESRFVWNYQLLKFFFQKHADSASKEASLASVRWGLLLPLLHGSVQAATFVTPRAVLRLLLIARRSAFFAGTRYRKRGISTAGDAANEVETEFIVYSYHLKAPFLRRALPTGADVCLGRSSGRSGRSIAKTRRKSSNCSVCSTRDRARGTAQRCNAGSSSPAAAAGTQQIEQDTQLEKQHTEQQQHPPQTQEAYQPRVEQQPEPSLQEAHPAVLGGPHEQQQHQQQQQRREQKYQQEQRQGGGDSRRQEQQQPYVLEFPFEFILFSHVQLRGSVPIFWSQEATVLPSMPPLTYTQTDVNYTATRRHCSSLFQRYGSPIYLLNLLRHVAPAPEEATAGVDGGQQQTRLLLSRSCSSTRVYHRESSSGSRYTNLLPLQKSSSRGSCVYPKLVGDSRSAGAFSLWRSSSKVLSGSRSDAVAASTPEQAATATARDTAAEDGGSSRTFNGGSRPAGAAAAAAAAAVAAAAGAAAAAGRASVRAAAAAGGGGERREEQESELGYLYSAAIQQLNQELPEELQLQFRWVDMRRVPRARETGAAAVRQGGATGSNEFFPASSLPGSSVPGSAASAAGAAAAASRTREAEVPYVRLQRLGLEMLHAVGCFSTNDPITWRAAALQWGVCRVNCLDCLDRTNDAQHVLHQQLLLLLLRRLRLVPAAVTQLDLQLSSILTSLMDAMGDRLAMQYGGSNAHKKQHVLTSNGNVTAGEEDATTRGYNKNSVDSAIPRCNDGGIGATARTDETVAERWRSSLPVASFFSRSDSYPSLAAGASGAPRSRIAAAAEFLWQRAVPGRWLLEDEEGSKKLLSFERLSSSPLFFLSLSTSVKRRYNNVLADRSKQQALNLLHQRFSPFDFARRREATPPLWDLGVDAWCHHEPEARTVFDPGSWWVLPLQRFFNVCRLAIVAKRLLCASCDRCSTPYRNCFCSDTSSLCSYFPDSKCVLSIGEACCSSVGKNLDISRELCSYNSCCAVVTAKDAAAADVAPGSQGHAATATKARNQGTTPEAHTGTALLATAAATARSRAEEPGPQPPVANAPASLKTQPGTPPVMVPAAAVEGRPYGLPSPLVAAVSSRRCTLSDGSHQQQEQQDSSSSAAWLQLFGGHPACVPPPRLLRLMHTTHTSCAPEGCRYHCCSVNNVLCKASSRDLCALSCCTNRHQRSTGKYRDILDSRNDSAYSKSSNLHSIGTDNAKSERIRTRNSCERRSCLSPCRLNSYSETRSRSCCYCWHSQISGQHSCCRSDGMRGYEQTDTFRSPNGDTTYTYEPWREEIDREALEIAAAAVAYLKDTIQNWSGKQLHISAEQVDNVSVRDGTPSHAHGRVAAYSESDCCSRCFLDKVNGLAFQRTSSLLTFMSSSRPDHSALEGGQGKQSSFMRCSLAELFLPLFVQPMSIVRKFHSDTACDTGTTSIVQGKCHKLARQSNHWRGEDMQSFHCSSFSGGKLKSDGDTSDCGNFCSGSDALSSKIKSSEIADAIKHADAELTSSRAGSAKSTYISLHEAESLYEGERVFSCMLTAPAFVAFASRSAAQRRKSPANSTHFVPVGKRRQRRLAATGSAREEDWVWLLSPSTLLRVSPPSAPPPFSSLRVAALYRQSFIGSCCARGNSPFLKNLTMNRCCGPKRNVLTQLGSRCLCSSAFCGACLPSFAQTATAFISLQNTRARREKVLHAHSTPSRVWCGSNQISLWRKDSFSPAEVLTTTYADPACTAQASWRPPGNVHLPCAATRVLHDGNLAPRGTNLIEETKTPSVVPVTPPLTAVPVTTLPRSGNVSETAAIGSATCFTAEWEQTHEETRFTLKPPATSEDPAGLDLLSVASVPRVQPGQVAFVEQLLGQEEEFMRHPDRQRVYVTTVERTSCQSATPDQGRGWTEAMLFPANLPLSFSAGGAASPV